MNFLKNFIRVLNGNFLAKDLLINNIPFIIYIAINLLIYISYGYWAEDTIRKTNKINKELKDLRSEYISIKSELMYKSKLSELAKEVVDLGLKESTEPPKVIKLNKKTFDKLFEKND